MVRRNFDNIEIIEPPLGELTKKHSYKRTCFTGCGCFIFIIVAVIIGLKIYIGPGPQMLKNVPANFPEDIVIYDKDAIDQITSISGKYKNRGIEIAAFFPKVILSPLLMKKNPDPNNPNAPQNKQRSFWDVISTPVSDHRDTIQVEWRNMDADPNFLISYYKKEFRKNNYAIDVESAGQAVQQFSFSREDGITGSLYAEGGTNAHPGTEYAILTINLPAVE